jgi:hypothetical protein
MSAVLKLVQPQPFCDEVDVNLESSSGSVHSLQSAFAYLSPWQPQVVKYILERFSKKNDLVLDPYCGAGAVGLECLMAGREFFGCSNEHSLVRLAQARLSPADIAEVALRLQFVNFKRPVDIRGFQTPFPLFFDVDTYCELMNLKSSLKGAADHVDRFVQFVVASVLHGHTVGHLSVYTSPQAALSPDAQASLNRKRGELPSYRAVSARVIKKSAGLLRDGIPSVLCKDREATRVVCADARNISSVTTGKVSLALVCPEQPGHFDHGLRSWLRAWWLGLELPSTKEPFSSVDEWQDYINEVMFEMARLVKQGGRAVVRVGNGRIGSKIVSYREQLANVLNNGFGEYWSLEGTVVERYAKSSGLIKGGSSGSSEAGAELVVLRRK